MNKLVIGALLTATSLALPTAATADPGHGKGDAPVTGRSIAPSHARTKVRKPRAVTFVFKGSYSAEGTVQVRAGNAHARKGGFVGEAVSFDFASARVVVADTNADQQFNLADVKAGDEVVVKARLVKGTKHLVTADGQIVPLVGRQLIDKTNAPGEEAEAAEPQDQPTG